MHPYSSVSLWHDSMSEEEWGPARPALGGDRDADVAIIGGGYTGLWTAYYLAATDPSLRIVVLEGEAVGFGASGRNGGWCSALIPMGHDAMRATHGHDAAVRMQRSMFATVAEVESVVAHEGIDCHFAKGGTLVAARSAVQAARLKAKVAAAAGHGFQPDDLQWLEPAEAAERIGTTSTFGATYTPHCAAIHPARLARGLGRVVEGRGVAIHEGTRVLEIGNRRVVTDHGTVRAPVIVRATEAFTARLPGLRRSLAPIYSLMIATEPLPDDAFASIGLHQRETFADGRRMIIYGQRTADNRLAFGGRGAPYHFASAIKPEFEQEPAVHAGLHATLQELFPVIGDARITHHWGGAIAAPRDWWCSVGYDRDTGLAWAGGYVGDGVSTTNLSGRTLAALITGTESELTTLPWVAHQSRLWEPEPLRWLGINSMVRMPSGADRYEARTGRAERWRSAIVERLTGR